MNNNLHITNLSKTYANGINALSEVSLHLENGMFGLLGPNGAGKSSLMKTIVGLQRPTSGSLSLNGTDVLANPLEIKRQVGYLPQDFGIYPRVSALDLLDHIAALKGISNKKERTEQVTWLLEKTNLYAERKRDVSSFSGGMRQRFGIAQALLGNPRCIIVDEPTAGLDPEERNRFNTVLAELGKDVIVILSTHLVEDVRNLCSSMAIINKGRVIAHGTPAEFLAAVENCVWQITVEPHEITRYKERCHILSTHIQSGAFVITALAETCPDAGFQHITPRLEDAYFAHLYGYF